MFNFKIKNSYSFEVHPSSVLGNDFKNVTILAILDRATAETITNITVKHPLIYPLLPAGTINDPDAYTYLKIEHESGDTTVIAYEWIRTDTIVEVESQELIITVRDANTAGDVEIIRNALAYNGFNDVTINVVHRN